MKMRTIRASILQMEFRVGGHGSGSGSGSGNLGHVDVTIPFIIPFILSMTITKIYSFISKRGIERFWNENIKKRRN